MIHFLLSAFSFFIVLKDVLVKTSPSDVLEVANQMLTTTLVKNLANMDHATKRNTVSILCIKGIIYPKINFLSSFTYPHFIPKLHEFIYLFIFKKIDKLILFKCFSKYFHPKKDFLWVCLWASQTCPSCFHSNLLIQNQHCFCCFLMCILQLENMCDILSRQGSGVRDRAVFVVFSSALLQSLQSMTESQHLHTAQSVYKLLEPLLIQVYTIQPEQVRVQMQEQMSSNYYLPVTISRRFWLGIHDVHQPLEQEDLLMLVIVFKNDRYCSD